MAEYPTPEDPSTLPERCNVIWIFGDQPRG